MSLPHLVIADDSDAVRAYLSAALASEYRLTTACHGREALEKIRAVRPDAVLLDLSMPQLSGDEVLFQMLEDPALREIPAIIISSERQRGEACVGAGAAAFLEKPVRSEALRILVGRVLDEAARRKRVGNLQVLFGQLGQREVGLPLSCVRSVVMHPALHLLSPGKEGFELEGEPVGVLSLAAPLGEGHRVPLEDRKLVVLRVQGGLIALGFDRVRDPEEISAADILDQQPSLGARVRTERGLRAVIDPLQLTTPEGLARLIRFMEEAPPQGAG